MILIKMNDTLIMSINSDETFIKPNSFKNPLNQILSLTTSQETIYSASVKDEATNFCNLDFPTTTSITQSKNIR